MAVWSSLAIRSPTHGSRGLVASGREPVHARARSTSAQGLRFRVRSRILSSFSSPFTLCPIVYASHATSHWFPRYLRRVIWGSLREDLPRLALRGRVGGEFLCRLLCKALTPPSRRPSRWSVPTRNKGDRVRQSPACHRISGADRRSDCPCRGWVPELRVCPCQHQSVDLAREPPYPLPPLHSSLASAARTASTSVRTMLKTRNA
jgi:hypothetical protein